MSNFVATWRQVWRAHKGHWQVSSENSQNKTVDTCSQNQIFEAVISAKGGDSWSNWMESVHSQWCPFSRIQICDRYLVWNHCNMRIATQVSTTISYLTNSLSLINLTRLLSKIPHAILSSCQFTCVFVNKYILHRSPLKQHIDAHFDLDYYHDQKPTIYQSF